MAKVADFYPSQYLRCADLAGKDRTLTIDRVDTALFENDGRKQKKPVVHFREPNVKPFVANKTNFLLIAGGCGDDTDQWPGKQIVLYPDMVPFKGSVTEAIRVRRVWAPPAPTQIPPPVGFDDEIPF
jgi:hypothetical protein